MSSGRALPQDEALQREIEQARAELSHTVHELALKLDLASRLKQKGRELAATASQNRAVLGGGAAGAVILVVLLRRHHRD